jgi:alkanesulfonate monooxygenase SsuD/methylene tetrahydromethanopterin reductase-like flavin-dependent oxidoreductase (luciferase family)
VLRAALAGERVVFKGEALSVDGFRLSRPLSRPVPIYIAALRPGMLRVAGQVGEGVILNWGSPEDVPKSVAVVRDAATQAGRNPEAIEITARLFIHLDPPGPESDLMARRHIAAYMNVPVYRAYQEWLGRGEALGPMWTAWAAGDRRGAVAAIPDRVIDELIGRGSVADIRARIRRYFEAGLDTAFLQLQTAEQDPVRKREIVLASISTETNLPNILGPSGTASRPQAVSRRGRPCHHGTGTGLSSRPEAMMMGR